MLLDIRNLVVEFESDGGRVRAVDRLSLEVRSGESIGLVGASGSGKTVTSLAIMGLLAPKPAVLRGQVFFRGRDILGMNPREIAAFRGKSAAIVFQEPMSALNPTRTIGFQIAEAVHAHGAPVSRRAARARVLDVLRSVEISEPERVKDLFPHQMSGGMRQRALIAMAIVHDPALLILDEATTSIDAITAARILALIDRIRKNAGTSVLMITHDLAIAGRHTDRILVMHEGRIVEEGTPSSILCAPKDAHTRRLIDAAAYVSAPRGPSKDAGLEA